MNLQTSHLSKERSNVCSNRRVLCHSGYNMLWCHQVVGQEDGAVCEASPALGFIVCFIAEYIWLFFGVLNALQYDDVFEQETDDISS